MMIKVYKTGPPPMEHLGDKALLALVALIGSFLGVLGTIGAGAIGAWARNKKTDVDETRMYLESGLEAQRIANGIYRQVQEDTREDRQRLREKLDRVEEDNADLRQHVVSLENGAERRDREREAIIEVISSNVGTDTLEILQEALDEDSDVEDVTLERDRPDV